LYWVLDIPFLNLIDMHLSICFILFWQIGISFAICCLMLYVIMEISFAKLIWDVKISLIYHINQHKWSYDVEFIKVFSFLMFLVMHRWTFALVTFYFGVWNVANYIYNFLNIFLFFKTHMWCKHIFIGVLSRLKTW
jgi:hypothetical protein